MPGPEILTFTEALAEAAGNAARPHWAAGKRLLDRVPARLFSDSTLLGAATFQAARGDVREVFDLVSTTDFEQVIEQLQVASVEVV